MPGIAQGTIVSWGATAVPYIESFSGPGMSQATVEVSTLDITSAQYIAAKMFDAGEFSINLKWDPVNAVHMQLADDVVAGQLRSMIVTFPAIGTASTTTYTFDAIPTGYQPAGAVKGELTAALTFKGTGTVAFAP